MLKNVLIVVDDIEKSIEFYRDVFGLQVILKNEGNVILSEGLVLQDAAEHSLSCALSLYISKRKKWEDIVGTGRILPAFPGAGGSINDDGILDASLTPRIIQLTTFPVFRQ